MRKIYCKLLITALVLSTSGQSSSFNLVYGTDGASVKKTRHDIRQDLYDVCPLDDKENVNIFVFTKETVREKHRKALSKYASPQVSVNVLNPDEIIGNQIDASLYKVFSNVVKVVEHSQYGSSTTLTAEQASLCQLKALSVFMPYLLDGQVDRFFLRGLLAEQRDDVERRTDGQSAEHAKVYSCDLPLLEKVFLWWKSSISEYYNNQDDLCSGRKDGEKISTFDRQFKENMRKYWRYPPRDFRELYASSLRIVGNKSYRSKGKLKFGMPVVTQPGQCTIFGWTTAEQLWNQIISAWCQYHDNVILSALNIIEDSHKTEFLGALDRLMSNEGKHADILQYLRIMTAYHGQFAPELEQKPNSEMMAKVLRPSLQRLSAGVTPSPDDTSLDLNPVQ